MRVPAARRLSLLAHGVSICPTRQAVASCGVLCCAVLCHAVLCMLRLTRARRRSGEELCTSCASTCRQLMQTNSIEHTVWNGGSLTPACINFQAPQPCAGKTPDKTHPAVNSITPPPGKRKSTQTPYPNPTFSASASKIFLAPRLCLTRSRQMQKHSNTLPKSHLLRLRLQHVLAAAGPHAAPRKEQRLVHRQQRHVDVVLRWESRAGQQVWSGTTSRSG